MSAMKRTSTTPVLAAFEAVSAVGLTLPDVEVVTRYDGSRVLKAAGCFMAGLATHPSAEPGSLVVRIDLEDRQLLLEEAPETYYVTDYYQRYPLVLARLSRLDQEALRELLSISWRLTLAKSGRRPGSAARRRTHVHAQD
jgi:hypothetical protein